MIKLESVFCTYKKITGKRLKFHYKKINRYTYCLCIAIDGTGLFKID